MEENGGGIKGMKFPPQADAATGAFVTSQGAESIRDCLYLILMTQKTERKGNPEFGSRTMSYTFADTSPTVLHMMEYRLEEDIIAQEPRISDVTVRMEKQDAEEYLYIYVDYLVRETGERGQVWIKRS